MPPITPLSHQHRMQVDGVDVHIEGPSDGPAVLLLHGWPDTIDLWDATVAALCPRYRCIRFTLPGFDLAQPARPTSVARMVQCIDAVLDAVLEAVPGAVPGAADVRAPVTLLLHDWGCMFGYEYAARRPERVARIVGVDIGDHDSPALKRALGPKGRRMVLGYQLWLALAYKIGGGVGTRMARWMARQLRCRTPAAQIGAQMGYPYAMRWFGTAGGLKSLSPVDRLLCPMLYVYGARKYFMFHSPEWLAQLQARPGCAVQALPTGHWVMRDKPAEFHACVLAWLDAAAAPC